MTPEIEAHTEVHKTGHRWIDISVAACALVVSITSLCVAILHGRTMERMADANARLVAANSWPILQSYTSDWARTGNEPVVSLNVSNRGVGPAKVEALELFWDGKPVRNVQALLELCCHAATEAAFGSGRSSQVVSSGRQVLPEGFDISSLQGDVLTAGETRRLYELRRTPANQQLFDQLARASLTVTMRACYCSVFDECWATDFHTLKPEPVRQCAEPKIPFTTR